MVFQVGRTAYLYITFLAVIIYILLLLLQDWLPYDAGDKLHRHVLPVVMSLCIRLELLHLVALCGTIFCKYRTEWPTTAYSGGSVPAYILQV